MRRCAGLQSSRSDPPEMPRSGIKAGEVAEPPSTRLAPVTLAMRLCIVAPIPDHRRTAAAGATHALWPAMLTHQLEALGIVHQAGKVDQVRCSHDRRGSSREPVGCPRSGHHIRYALAAPPGLQTWNPTRAGSISAKRDATRQAPRCKPSLARSSRREHRPCPTAGLDRRGMTRHGPVAGPGFLA